MPEQIHRNVPPPVGSTGLREAGDLASIASTRDALALVLRPCREELVRLLLTSLIFVGIGLLTRTPVTLLGATVFGLGAIAFAVMLLPGAAYLSLDAWGFTMCTLFRKHRVIWSDAGSFGVTRIGGRAAVGYNSVEHAALRPRLTAVNIGLSGYGCALPDTYGLSAQELAELMNEARLRALAGVR